MQIYDEMVDTGVDWLGLIPAGWSTVSTSRLFSFAKGVEAQKLTKEYLAANPGRYPVYSGQTSNQGVIGFYPDYEFEEENGVILVTTVGAKAMTARYIQGKFSLSQNCLIMRELDKTGTVSTKYYSYAVQPLFKKERALIPDHMQPSMRMSDLSSYKLPLPAKKTQQKIADFLDTETAKIDNLIARQERLLQLLEEKRRATITRAITRGLDPNVELKETNIPWLGKIPADWDLYRAKYLFKKIQDKPLESDEVVTAFRDGEVVLRRLRRVDGFTFADKEIGYQHVKVGDLVIHAMDAFAGAVGVSKSEGKMSPVCSICRPVRPDVNTEYFAQLIRAMASTNYLVAIAKGIRERSTDFRFGDFSDMTFPLPPLNEQIGIIKKINDESEKSKNLKQKIQTQITLLRERRTSLISHAVTGKIKI